MNKSAAGLSIRFFKVTIPTGPDLIGKSTGKAFRPKRLPLNRSVEPERIAKKRPVTTKALNN